MIDSKNIDQFSVFPDVKPFKIIKKGRTEIKEVIKKNPKKYSKRTQAETVRPINNPYLISILMKGIFRS